MKLHRWFSILSVLVLVLGAIGVGDSQAGPVDTPPILLRAGTFNPGQGELLVIPPELESTAETGEATPYYIVQFRGPVEQDWVDQVSALGSEVLGYIPDFAFKVRMNRLQAAHVGELASVIWVGEFQPAYKLNPNLDMAVPNLVRVRIEAGADIARVWTQVTQSGAQVFGGERNYLLAAADGAGLQAIAHIPDVAWVEPFILPEKHNEYGAGVIVGANTAHANGYRCYSRHLRNCTSHSEAFTGSNRC